MTTGSGGSIRAWSVTGGGLLGHFTAVQEEHESVLSMTTDLNNSILVTGDSAGFVKVWDFGLNRIRTFHLQSSHNKRKLSVLNDK